jgi:hypothetical protein
MTVAAYLVGLALTGLIVVALVVSAWVLRTMLLPDATGPHARVAEAVVAIAVLVLVGEALGTLGWLHRLPVLIVYVGLAVVLLGVRRWRGVVEPRREAPSRLGGGVFAATLLVGFLLLLPWSYTTLNVIHHGIREYDSMAYHLPFAARFMQTGSTTGLQFMGNAPVSFYPMNSELVHALGMVLFRRDFLSVFINYGWLALALLAGWCIGSPRGVGAATLAATALVLSIRIMAFSQGGTAKNDLMGLSLVLAAAALWSYGREGRGYVVLAAMAAGLAAGTRLTMWGPVLGLAVVAVLFAPRGRRLKSTGYWLLGIVVGGGYWYARNLAAVGNPAPWIGVKIAGIVTLPSTSGPADCGSRSVAHYLSDPHFIGSRLIPQLIPSLGRLWWIVVALTIAGIAVGLAARSAPTERGLALVALISGVVYLLTPATAGGFHGSCFGFNTRFTAPALTLGIILLPLMLARCRVHLLVPILVSAVVIAVDAHIPLTPLPVIGAAAVAGAVGIGALGLRRGAARRTLLAGAAVAVLVVAAGGWALQRVYFHNRYTQPRLQQPVDSVSLALGGAVQARIAVSGFFETFPLNGVDLSNRVVVPAAQVKARFVPYANCRSWLTGLWRGRYAYVVTAQEGGGDPVQGAWTRRFPGAREVRSSPVGTIRAGLPWSWQLFSLPRHPQANPASACG